MKATQLSIQHGWLFGSAESKRSSSNHSKAIPFKYNWAKVTFAQSWWKAFGWSVNRSSHWTRKVQCFFGSVPSKVSRSWTLARDKEDSLEQQAERENWFTVRARLLRTAMLGSSSPSVSRKSSSSSSSSSSLLSSLSSLRSSPGPSSPG